MDQNIWKKPLVGKLHESYVQRLTDTFSQLKNCKKPYFLTLIKYLDKQPKNSTQKTYSTFILLSLKHNFQKTSRE